jgi:hypothetical protein
MTLCLMTNWDHPWPEEVENDENANSFWTGMDLWSRAIRSINAQSVCNCCDLPITSAEVAAMVVETLDDNLMAIRWVCRRCGPTQEQARLMATALMPATVGGTA